jgi:nicotinamidase-related amidase
MSRTRELPVPPHYAPEHSRRFSYAPDQAALLAQAVAWRDQHGIRPAGADQATVRLLLIDVQKDFCFPEGSLYVGGRSGTGALDDNDRIARLIYRNLEQITDITCTLDTHLPFQIFFPSFWLDRDDAPPASNREVRLADIREGHLRPNPAIAWWLCDGDEGWLRRQVERYCAELEQAGRYTLYLWPPHCLLGSDGHALSGVVHEARLFHAYVRGAQSWIETKGDHALSENYSVLAPEVLLRHDGRVLAERNTRLVEVLLDCDALLVAGQAASHCVKSSVEDLLDEIRARDASLARKVYLLRDCMSSVVVPDPAQPGQPLYDFTPQAEAALARFAEAGMHVVDSTVPRSEWLDFPG